MFCLGCTGCPAGLTRLRLKRVLALHHVTQTFVFRKVGRQFRHCVKYVFSLVVIQSNSESDCSANPCVVFCFWSELVADCCYFALVDGPSSFTSCMGKCIATSYEIGQPARDKAAAITFPLAPCHISSSSITNSSSGKPASAASTSSAVSVGAVDLSKCGELRVCARPTNSKWPLSADKTQAARLQEHSRAMHVMGCHKNIRRS